MKKNTRHGTEVQYVGGDDGSRVDFHKPKEFNLQHDFNPVKYGGITLWAPKYFKWIATDEDGDIRIFESPPNMSYDCWENSCIWNKDSVEGCDEHLILQTNQNQPDWKNSLMEIIAITEDV